MVKIVWLNDYVHTSYNSIDHFLCTTSRVSLTELVQSFFSPEGVAPVDRIECKGAGLLLGLRFPEFLLLLSFSVHRLKEKGSIMD